MQLFPFLRYGLEADYIRSDGSSEIWYASKRMIAPFCL